MTTTCSTRTMRLLASLALLLATLMVAVALASASAAPANPAPTDRIVAFPPVPGTDCTGDAPQPRSPYGHLAVKPAITANGDPFVAGGPSIESVYGTTYRWWAYDNGCGVGSGALPSMGAQFGNVLMEIAGVIPNWGHFLMDAVIDPSGWIGSIDPIVDTVTHTVARSVWTPWLLITLSCVAIVVLWRARTGLLSGSITAATWAALVMVFTTWAMNYPAEAVHLVDDGVQTAVVSIATGFADGDEAPNGVELPDAPRSPESPWTPQYPGRAKALVSTDKLYNALNKSILYRAWSAGVFGDPDSPTATKYGPEIFKATHFSFAEYDAYKADPEGKGKTLMEAKAKAFKDNAEQIKKTDPVGYNTFTGNDWSSRLTTATLNLVVVAAAGLFLLVSALCVLIAYIITRLAVPITPALGVVFILDVFRSKALALGQRIAGPVVMGPVFLIAGLIVLRYNAAIAESSLNPVLKLALILLVSLLAWKILKPMTIVVPRPRVPGLETLKRYLVMRKGAHDGVEDALEDSETDPTTTNTPGTAVSITRPVHQDAPGLGFTGPVHIVHHHFMHGMTTPGTTEGPQVWAQGQRTIPDSHAIAASPADIGAAAFAADVPGEVVPTTREFHVRTSGVTVEGHRMDHVEPGMIVMRHRDDFPATTDDSTPAWKVTGDQPKRTVTIVEDAADQSGGAGKTPTRAAVAESNTVPDEDGRETYRIYDPEGDIVLVRDDAGEVQQ